MVCELRILATLVVMCRLCDVTSVPEPTISVVIASLGGPNADGEDEDLSWLSGDGDARSISTEKTVHLYQRMDPYADYFIDTLNGNECLTYTKYIIDHFDTLPE